MNIKLDAEEQELLASVDAGEWRSKGHIGERIIELQTYLKQEKKKAISIRLPENDLYELKRKSLENGVPYQNVIQMLVHQYTNNKINLEM